MKSCTKLRMMQLTTLFLLLIFSCKKEHIKELNNSPHTDSREEFSNADLYYQNLKKSESISFQQNSQIVLDTEENLRQLILNALIQTAFHPEVYGLTSSQVETRSCPNSSYTTASGDSGNVHTIILDYGTGCNSSGNVQYEGTVTITLNGDLNQDGTTVNIMLEDNFKINSDNDMDGNIELTYFDDFGQIYYFIDSIDLDNMNESNSSLTEVFSISDQLNGGFYVAENTTGDIQDSPLNILNDTIQYGGCFRVHCPNGETLQTCSTSDIYYTLECGVPYEGNLTLDTLNADGSYGMTGLPPGVGTYGQMDFSFPNAINQGVCDSLIFFENNTNGEVDTLRL